MEFQLYKISIKQLNSFSLATTYKISVDFFYTSYLDVSIH